jgi:serine/threonine protein kinase
MEGYEVLEKLGSGSFGTIRKIMRKADRKILVWKEIRYGRMNEKEKSMLVSEVNILRELKHPNIVRYKVGLILSTYSGHEPIHEIPDHRASQWFFFHTRIKIPASQHSYRPHARR